MKKETQNWLAKARSDLGTAEYLLKGEKYEEASFFCQQSVEKALKAVILSKTGRIIKTHDLVFLAGKAGLPEDLKERCKELTMVYVATRYPDTPEFINGEERAGDHIQLAKKVLEWLKEAIS